MSLFDMTDVTLPEVGRVTFETSEEAITAWLEYESGRLADSTVSNYEGRVRAFAEAWPGRNIVNLNRIELHAFLDKLSTTCRSLRKRSEKFHTTGGLACNVGQDLAQCGRACPKFERKPLSTLDGWAISVNRFYRFLAVRGVVEANHFHLARQEWYESEKRRAVDPEIRMPTRREIEHIVNSSAINIGLRFLILLLAKTGLRIAEAMLLRTDKRYWDPDNRRGEIPLKPDGSTGKRKGNRQFVIDAQLRDFWIVYEKWRAKVLPGVDHGMLLVSSRGAPMSQTTSSDRSATFRRIMRRLGLEDEDATRGQRINPHCFRHFFSNEIKAQGLDNTWYAVLRGQRLPGTQKHYVHSPKEFRNIAAAYDSMDLTFKLRSPSTRLVYEAALERQRVVDSATTDIARVRPAVNGTHPSQVREWIAALNSPSFKVALYLVGKTGLTMREVINLRTEDVDLINRQLNTAWAPTYLDSELTDTLEGYLAWRARALQDLDGRHAYHRGVSDLPSTNCLIINLSGGRLYSSSISNALKKEIGDLGVGGVRGVRAGLIDYYQDLGLGHKQIALLTRALVQSKKVLGGFANSDHAEEWFRANCEGVVPRFGVLEFSATDARKRIPGMVRI